jgi:hemolysin activation/secretion protein
MLGNRGRAQCALHRNMTPSLRGQFGLRNQGDSSAHNMVLQGSRALHSLVVIIGALLLTATAARAAAPPAMTSAVIRGSSVYGAPALFETYRASLGQPLTAGVATAVANALAHLYERDGYARPELYVDERPMAAGILRIEVYEPRFTRVIFAGSQGPYAQRLEALGARIVAVNPVRPKEVQRALKAMRLLPGLAVIESVARDAAVRNGFILTLTVSYKEVEGLVRLSNRGSKEIGPWFADAQLVGNDLLGQDEKLGVLATATTDFKEYEAAGAFADVPVGAAGTHLSALGLYSYSVPHVPPGDPVDTFRRTLVQLRATQPLLASATASVNLVGGVDIDNQITDENAQRLRDDRLRIVDLGTQAAWAAFTATRYNLVFDLRKGLDALGSQLFAEDLVPDLRRKDFLLWRAQLTQLTQLDERWSLRLDALLQHSGYVLPYSEQLTIGGQVLGRGFEISEVAGDSGGDGRVELRRLLSRLNGTGELSLYGYYDYGAVWSQDGSPAQSAAVTGIGAAFTRGTLAGSLEVAQPLIHPDVDGSRSPRVLLEVTKTF